MTDSNNNEALYRRYRPSDFSEVRGQEHITKVLSQAVENDNVSHAYLFSGRRGIGKTSAARILAKELGTSDRDLYEIDAASNRGIDDIRELKEAVQTQPFDSRFKVYIIDEVHMLTTQAFNALLKTLEEPPSFVIFVLATTEMEDLPETVISRCEVHHFREPNRDLLQDTAVETAKKEGFELKPEAGELLALLADGSFRDLLGGLQKVLRAHDDEKEPITRSEVEEVTGTPAAATINELIKSIDEKDGNAALQSVNRAAESNIDMSLFYELVVEKVLHILLLQNAPDLKESIFNDLSANDEEFVEKMSKGKEGGKNINAKTLHTLLLYYSRVGHTHVPSLPLELAVMKLCQG